MEPGMEWDKENELEGKITKKRPRTDKVASNPCFRITAFVLVS